MKKITHSSWLFVGISMFVLSGQSWLSAQDKKTVSMEEANAFFQAKDWPNAVEAFKTMTEHDSSKGQAWLRLGLSYHSMKQFESAITAYEQAERLGFSPARTRYNLACAQSLMKQKEAAFEWLDKALTAGFKQVQTLETDLDLVTLRADPRFKDALQRADKNARPCEFNPKRRAFDFWVGAWDVFNPQGEQVGTNVIEKDLNGCMLVETGLRLAAAMGRA